MLPYFIQFIWTPIAVFVVGYILLRLMGKKAVSEMSSFDLLVTLVLGTAITEPIVTKRLAAASYYSVAIAVIYMILSSLTLKNTFKKFLTSNPTVLIKSGDINEKGLKKTRLTINELLGEVRVNGYTKIQDVELAVMEETGKISVIPTEKARSVQTSDLGLQPTKTYIPIPLIIDGKILDENLGYLQKNRDWLFQQTNTANAADCKNISLATFDPSINSVVADRINPVSQNLFNYQPKNTNS